MVRHQSLCAVSHQSSDQLSCMVSHQSSNQSLCIVSHQSLCAVSHQSSDQLSCMVSHQSSNQSLCMVSHQSLYAVCHQSSRIMPVIRSLSLTPSRYHSNTNFGFKTLYFHSWPVISLHDSNMKRQTMVYW